MPNDENHDGDTTKPDLPSGLVNGPERSRSDLAEDALAAIVDSARTTLAAIGSLVAAIPGDDEPGRARHLEVLAHQWGLLGELAHDTRRVTIQLRREVKP